MLELFLIASVASVLGIRAFLAATGYPQIGGDGLHIAHMLWGGLFMLVALVMLFSLMGIVATRIAAILGGIGFGTFIDELGKFITSDNDYFYQPTIGLIYIIFVALALFIAGVRRRGHLSRQETLANALHRLVDATDGRLDVDSKRHIAELLDQLDPDDPLVASLRRYVDGLEPEQTADVRFYFRIKARLIELYRSLVMRRVFVLGITGAFVFFSLFQLVFVGAALMARGFFGAEPTEEETFVALAEAISVTVTSVMVAIGALQATRLRLSAFRWFERAVLVNIFVTQVFRFFASELSAVLGLSLDILVYIALRFMIQREQEMAERTEFPATNEAPLERTP